VWPLCGCTWVKEPCASAKVDVQGKRALYMYRAKEPCTCTGQKSPVHLQRPLYLVWIYLYVRV